MVDLTNTIGGIFAGVSLLYMYFTISELKYTAQDTVRVTTLAFFSLSILYMVLLILGVNIFYVKIVSYTVPSFFLCYFFSRRKDGRFIFNFFTILIIGTIIEVLSICARYCIYNSGLLYCCVKFGIYLLVWRAFLCQREKFLRLQRYLPSSFNKLSIITVFYYISLNFILLYPKPIEQRIEYMPIFLVMCLNTVILYYVIYSTLMGTLKIRETVKDNEKYKIIVKKKNSQLKNQKVYYKLAFLDVLTGVKNRTAYEEKLEEYQQKEKYIEEFCCLSMDLNNLKKINDSLGHDAGDELIRGFASILEKALMVTTTDIFRTGGDEFVAFFYRRSEDQVGKAIKNLNKEIVRYNVTAKYKISVAIGVAYKGKEERIDDVISRADSNMYYDKRQYKAGLA